MSFYRITVKVGSNVLTRPDGTLDVTRMSAIVDQVAALHRQGIQIILVSSGAVASGRSELKGRLSTDRLDTVDQRQLYSAVGQAKLINKYYELFRDHGISCGQVLTTKESFGSRGHYLNQKNCMEVMLQEGVVPIVNENDTISVTELMFTDNDELSGLIATMMSADLLILLSNIDGIYTGNPSDPNAQLISNGKRPGVLLELVHVNPETGSNEIAPEVRCTRLVADKHEVSNVKKWIAHSEDFSKGAIYLNDGAVRALLGEKAASILPVGVTRVEGTFEADDIVRILADTDGSRLGVGKVSCSSDRAQKLLGKKGQKPLVHYDYLWLE